MTPETTIENILEGKCINVYVNLKTADGIANAEDFDVYGAATDGRSNLAFDVNPTGEQGQYLVTIPGLRIERRFSYRYQICARRRSDGVEWVIKHGAITLRERIAGIEDTNLYPPELHIDCTLEPNSIVMTVENMSGARGERGYSAYEVAVQEGFEGSEAEWLESIRQQTATLAVEQVTPLVERSEAAAEDAQNHADNAETFMHTAITKAEIAGGHAEAAEASKDAAAAEVDKAAAEVDKAKQEKQTAAEYAEAAAKSAEDAAAERVKAEQARQDAQAFREGLEQAATDADAASQTATQKATEASGSAAQAAADKLAAEQAKTDAQAAQGKAEAARGAAEASAEAAANSVELAEWALPADHMRFAHVTTLDELAECAPDLRDVEVWRYPLPNLVMESSPSHPMDYYFPKLRKLFLYSEEDFKVWWNNPALSKKRLEELRCVFPKTLQIQYLLYGTGGAEKVWVYAPNAKTHSLYFISAARAKELYIFSKVTEWGKWHLGLDTVEILWYLGDSVKSIDGSIGKTIREIHCGFPKATNVNFQVSKLDKASVLRVVNSLQAYDASAMSAVPTLTLGVDPALDGDEEINAALLNAQAAVEDGGKGWNVAVSGFTITAGAGAATMGLRRLVYVKREMATDGGYIDADGQRWNVRWGNTVLENWQANEELGYEAFPSVESALEEWGLTEWKPEWVETEPPAEE